MGLLGQMLGLWLLLKNVTNYYPNLLYYFTSPPTIYKSVSESTSWSTFGMDSLLILAILIGHGISMWLLFYNSLTGI